LLDDSRVLYGGSKVIRGTSRPKMISAKSLFHRVEFAWHTVAFILLMGAFIPLWRQKILGVVDPALGDPVQRAFLGVAYLGVILLTLHPRRALAIARRSALLWLLVGWAIISGLWSALPDVTLRRGVSALLASLYGLLLVVRYPFRSVLQMLGIALAIVIIASLGAALLFPEWGVMGPPHPGAWQGVLYHKNALGRTSILALLVFWILAQSRKGLKKVSWLVLELAALVALVGSRSMTAILIALILTASWLLLRGTALLPQLLRPALLSLGLAAAFPALFILPDYLEDILGLLGKDLTLTGRVPLWNSLIPLALQRPLLGYGYGAFWSATGPSASVTMLFPWALQAHNGYLDLWLENGLIGVLIAFALLLITLVRTGQRTLQTRDADVWRFAFLFTAFLVFSNVSEAMLLETGLAKGLYWVVFSYVYFLSVSDRITLAGRGQIRTGDRL
jgi:O-antigen ligase